MAKKRVRKPLGDKAPSYKTYVYQNLMEYNDYTFGVLCRFTAMPEPTTFLVYLLHKLNVRPPHGTWA